MTNNPRGDTPVLDPQSDQGAGGQAFLAGRSQARQLAFLALRQMDRQSTFANIALDRVLRSTDLPQPERDLVTELVYGITRRCRTLDALIDRYSRKPAQQQPPDLRRVLHVGFYQLAFLPQIPPAIVIHTTVELARQQKLERLTQVVNGILRAFLRAADPVDLTAHLFPEPFHRDPDAAQLALLESFPDWLVELWQQQLGDSATQALCRWFNQPPTIDLRVNCCRTDLVEVAQALQAVGIPTDPITHTRGGLRLRHHAGDITQLPGFREGWWTVQDASAQQVVEWLDPQPHERVIDCCAAPGGKSTAIAERMGNEGEVWALDRHQGRLARVEDNAQRLGLTCIRTQAIDLTQVEPQRDSLPSWRSADRVLLDAPCSGLGTLHRHADARWRQSPAMIEDLVRLQARLLRQVSRWVKPGGILVYATCTLHPAENQQQIEGFLVEQTDWHLDRDPWQIWPHREQRDGFFMARLTYLGSG
ncbi:MAG: 16S rRNA (cytosine(967)-C(5))-methyltransferase [Cyanobacteriota bacterium]|nr:16S rRNA (cytosine(967)-C(5))-methyltransferase [Cyanobacteriota bacterium]